MATATKAPVARKTPAKKVPTRKAPQVRGTGRGVVATPTTKSTPTAVEAHPLSALIPPPWYADDYISRDFCGRSDIAMLDYARGTKENVLMFGPTGPGKTSCVYAYAAQFNLPLVNVACNGAIDPSTLFGRPNLEADGTVTFIESNVVAVMRHGGILYLDEMNFAPPRIMAVLHGALDKRRAVTIPELGNLQLELHPNCQIVATYNPGYEGTKPLNKAFKNRFSIKVKFDYDEVVEAQLVLGTPTMLKIANLLRTAVKDGTLETPISTNLLREFEDHAFDMGLDLATLIFLNAFEDHERSSVSEIMDHHMASLEAEVTAGLAPAAQTGASK